MGFFGVGVAFSVWNGAQTLRTATQRQRRNWSTENILAIIGDLILPPKLEQPRRNGVLKTFRNRGWHLAIGDALGHLDQYWEGWG